MCWLRQSGSPPSEANDLLQLRKFSRAKLKAEQRRLDLGLCGMGVAICMLGAGKRCLLRLKKEGTVKKRGMGAKGDDGPTSSSNNYW
jgi:hypothetical protein